MEDLLNLKDKKVMVVGMAKSGISAAKFLSNMGAKVILNDAKSSEELAEVIKMIDFKVDLKTGMAPDSLVDGCEMIVVSPGVPMDLPFMKIAKEKSVKVISEIELAYKFCDSQIIAVTGTNGKTTTTTIIGELLKEQKKFSKVIVAGNIGLPITSEIENLTKNHLVVLEVSSFQLETIDKFKPNVSMILNFTPDHLNRHKTYENYIKAKCRIFENQDENDFLILNYDDELVKKWTSDAKANIYYFTLKGDCINKGAYVKDSKIYFKDDNQNTCIMNTNDLFIIGEHNIKNVLAAICSAKIYGVPDEKISEVLKAFRGVEHRIEFVREINGVKYYNDSKGTNVDASVQAIEAMRTPTVLIAGGYDKGVEFDELFEHFNGKIKNLILMGTTADKLEQTAKKHGYNNILRVNNMKEAVILSSKLVNSGDTVLLSPSCASWDMFDNYEQRGEIFKNEVMMLGR